MAGAPAFADAAAPAPARPGAAVTALQPGSLEEPAESAEAGRRQFEAGRYQDAVIVLRAVVRREPKNAAAYFWLGRAYFELHDYDRAIDAVQRSIDLDANESDSHWWLGRAYGNKAERDRSFLAARRSRQEFETAVRLDPSNVGARRDLMEFYLDAPRILGGSNDKALGQVDAIAAIGAVAGRLARAAYWALRRDVPRARAEYGAVLEMRPESIDAYLEAAEFYEKHPDIFALKGVIEGAERIAPSEPRLLYYHGVVGVMGGGDPEKAERSLRAYLELHERSDWPPHASAHRWLSQLYKSVGRTREAAAEEALSRGSKAKDSAAPRTE
jgi:tetratricopeptide (TPR) repeat protein